MADSLTLLIVQLSIILVLFIIIIFMLRQNIALKHERRIGKYGIDPINDDSSSMLDRLTDKYFDFVFRVRPYLKKSGLIVRMSKKYEKYVAYGKDDLEIDYITHKVVIGISFVLLTVFANVLQTKILSFWEVILFFIMGYYLFDIYLVYKEKRRIKLIKNEMLRAIIIMNNAFKSGKSTMQAIEIASMELPEPINEEFKKLYLDMKYGLGVGTVFERFAKRIDIEEARYLSASLMTLNRTGGNIVKVFSSIERTLFDKKKLEEELKNLTVSSNLIVKVLLFVPFVFVFIIYILDPSYFDPLFSSALGYMVLAVMFIMFIVYVWFLQRIMKVKV